MFMVLERWPDDGKHKPRSSTSQAVLQLLPFQNLVALPGRQRVLDENMHARYTGVPGHLASM